jgi:hypothetical protein
LKRSLKKPCKVGEEGFDEFLEKTEFPCGDNDFGDFADHAVRVICPAEKGATGAANAGSNDSRAKADNGEL